jgi:hypothetical protein
MQWPLPFESEDTALKRSRCYWLWYQKENWQYYSNHFWKRRRFLNQSIKCFHSRKSGWSTSSFFGLQQSAPSVIIRRFGYSIGRTYATLHSRWMPTENINNINTNDITSTKFLKMLRPLLWDESGQRGNHNYDQKRYGNRSYRWGWKFCRS